MKKATCNFCHKWLQVEAAGIEPGCSSDVTYYLPIACVTCPQCGAANALHGSDTKWRVLTLRDNELQTVVLEWDALPAHLRAAIMPIASTTPKVEAKRIEPVSRDTKSPLPGNIQESPQLRRPPTGSCNRLPENDLRNAEPSLGVSCECGGGNECPCSSPSDTEFSPSIQYIADAWPRLQPHVREAIFTLIDATLRQQQLEGGQS
jgi:hypothetical protein